MVEKLLKPQQKKKLQNYQSLLPYPPKVFGVLDYHASEYRITISYPVLILNYSVA